MATALGAVAASLSTQAAAAGPRAAVRAAAQPAGPILVQDGNPRAVLIVASDATEKEQLAAEEIQTHIKLITGATLPIATEATGAQGVAIYLGKACPDPIAEDLEPVEDSGDSFRLIVEGTTIQMAGVYDDGTLFAAYEFLEQLGVRWLMPGPYGTVTPESATVAAPIQDTVQVPTFASRQMHFVDNYLSTMPPGVDRHEGVDWARRRRLRGVSWNAHGIPLQPPANRDTEPELFILENGQRTAQLDVAHPEVLRRAIAAARTTLAANPNLRFLRMGPADGHGFGTSDWDAGDYDTVAGLPSVTDRYIKFFNLVLDDVQKDYPDVGLAFFCYDTYMLPPVREIPNRKIVPALAPINVDRMHSAADPAGWERRYFLRLADRWSELVDAWSFRGYLFNLADPGLPFSGIGPARDEFPLMVEHGSSEGLRVEVSASWGYDAPAFYLATKLMWQTDANPVPILREFMTAAYGPAAVPMARYYAAISDAMANAPYSAGRWFDHTEIFSAELMESLDDELTRAQSRAERSGDAGIIDRVHVARLAFDVGDAFLKSLRHWRDLEFADAKTEHNNAAAAFTEAVSHKPVALYPLRRNFLNLFNDPVSQAAERSSGGNQIAAMLPDTWSALLDRNDDAETDQVYAADVATDTWRELRTRGGSWSAQGLRYYRGVMWYRTTVTVDPAWANRKLTLWLGSLDESARVWVNGHEVPLVAGSRVFQPWEFDVTGFLQFDGDDEITLKITNVRLQELGTGGLTGPAFIWAGPDVVEPATAPPPYRRGDGYRQLDVPIAPITADLAGQHGETELPDTWFAMVDPMGDCANVGLWESVIPTESYWMSVQTRTRSWPQQGLGYYDGGLTYRTDVRLNGSQISRAARLLFTRLNGTARAWVNDHELEVAADGTATSVWEFHAGRFLKAGTNSIVVSVADPQPSADRPGGIAGPAYIVRR
jgi:hypothetical protein